jgi:hypothetical protein
MVKMFACHAGDPGSIPGSRALLFFYLPRSASLVVHWAAITWPLRYQAVRSFFRSERPLLSSRRIKSGWSSDLPHSRLPTAQRHDRLSQRTGCAPSPRRHRRSSNSAARHKRCALRQPIGSCCSRRSGAGSLVEAVRDPSCYRPHYRRTRFRSVLAREVGPDASGRPCHLPRRQTSSPGWATAPPAPSRSGKTASRCWTAGASAAAAAEGRTRTPSARSVPTTTGDRP